jgi:uncharacterized protein
MAHAINWFEIPVKNFERAKIFYENVLDIKMIIPFEGMKYAMFPADMQNGEIGGGLVEEKGYEPSQTGALIYLNGGEDLSLPLSRVEAAGARLMFSKLQSEPMDLWHSLPIRKGTELLFIQ